MRKERFDDYIARFNAQDPTAFDEYIAEDLHMLNGTLTFTGRQGMKDHYATIWSQFSEHLDVRRYVTDDRTIAIVMHTHFVALADDPHALFGAVRQGETFDFDGLIMYDVRDGQFRSIRVAYNSFVHTDLAGHRRDLGIPH